MASEYQVKKVVRGVVEAEALVSPGSFSFLGDVDMDTGEICASGNPNRGQSLKGRVLVYDETKGSSGGCVVLMTLAKRGLAPAALVTVKPADYNLAEGAIIASVPFVCGLEQAALGQLVTGQRLHVDADAGRIVVLDD